MGGADPTRPPEQRTLQSGETPWKRIAFVALVVYAILIVLFNREQVEISFVFFSAEISLVILILLCVGIGFAAGYLFDDLQARRRRSRDSG